MTGFAVQPHRLQHPDCHLLPAQLPGFTTCVADDIRQLLLLPGTGHLGHDIPPFHRQAHIVLCQLAITTSLIRLADQSHLRQLCAIKPVLRDTGFFQHRQGIPRSLPVLCIHEYQLCPGTERLFLQQHRIFQRQPLRAVNNDRSLHRQYGVSVHLRAQHHMACQMRTF